MWTFRALSARENTETKLRVYLFYERVRVNVRDRKCVHLYIRIETG